MALVSESKLGLCQKARPSQCLICSRAAHRIYRKRYACDCIEIGERLHILCQWIWFLTTWLHMMFRRIFISKFSISFFPSLLNYCHVFLRLCTSLWKTSSGRLSIQSILSHEWNVRVWGIYWTNNLYYTTWILVQVPHCESFSNGVVGDELV